MSGVLRSGIDGPEGSSTSGLGGGECGPVDIDNPHECNEPGNLGSRFEQLESSPLHDQSGVPAGIIVPGEVHKNVSPQLAAPGEPA